MEPIELAPRRQIDDALDVGRREELAGEIDVEPAPLVRRAVDDPHALRRPVTQQLGDRDEPVPEARRVARRDNRLGGRVVDRPARSDLVPPRPSRPRPTRHPAPVSSPMPSAHGPFGWRRRSARATARQTSPTSFDPDRSRAADRTAAEPEPCRPNDPAISGRPRHECGCVVGGAHRTPVVRASTPVVDGGAVIGSTWTSIVEPSSRMTNALAGPSLA